MKKLLFLAIAAFGYFTCMAEGYQVNVAFMYVSGCRVNNATGRYDDFLAKSYPALEQDFGISPDGKFTADYKVSAIIPAIGISYSF